MATLMRLLVLLFCVHVPAQAQELAGTFDQLRVLISPGDTLTITDTAGETVRGTLISLATSSLTLQVSGAPREFQETGVETIRARRPDSLRNGALIGLVVGGAWAGLAVSLIEGHAGEAAVVAAIYAGIGAGIGAGIDALIERPRVIYARRQAGLRVSPWRVAGTRGWAASYTFLF